MRHFGTWFISTVSVFVLPLCALAFEIPPEVREFLIQQGRGDLVARFEAIPRVSPEEFAKTVVRANVKLAGEGWNGAAFKDKAGNLYKFSHAVFGSEGVREAWTGLQAAPVFAHLDLEKHKLVDFSVVAARRPGEKEMIGTLLWSAYDSSAIRYLPDLISSDGSAYRRRFVPGIPLNEVLAMPEPPFEMNKVWAEIVRFQNMGEQMLAKSGLMVDLLSPANFIVSGSRERPTLELVDHEFVRPTPEAIDYYARRGVKIPTADFIQQYEVVIWPLMPEHIVQSKNWSMNFEQAVDYMQVRHGFGDRNLAIAALGALPEWKNVLYDFVADYSHVRQARQLHATLCQELLKGPTPENSD